MKHSLPCKSYRSLKQLKVSASDFGTMSMYGQFRASVYEFMIMVTKGVVHGVHKVVIQSSFGVIYQHKVS